MLNETSFIDLGFMMVLMIFQLSHMTITWRNCNDRLRYKFRPEHGTLYVPRAHIFVSIYRIVIPKNFVIQLIIVAEKC